MSDFVVLTTVGSQGESDVLCSKLRAFGIRCSERSALPEGGFGSWREILVNEDDVPTARELLAPEE